MILVERSHLHVAAKSHPGLSGKNNEDRYAVTAFRLSDETPTPVTFAIVSDGIGGHRAGEVAAEIAVEIISRAVADSDASQPVQTLREAIIRASQAILVQAESNPERKGMGATCACGWIIDDRLFVAYVGDSRIYLIRGDKITQISIDHTWIEEAISAGLLTPEQARNHPNAHVIRRYLGSRQPVEPDTRLSFKKEEKDDQNEANQGMRLLPGDQIVLCSDGLTDLVEKSEILALLKAKEQNEAIDEMIDLANKRGGHDNITIISLRFPQKAAQTKPSTTPKPKEKFAFNWACLTIGMLVVAIVILIAGGAYLVYRRFVQPGSATLTRTVVVTPSTPILTDTGLPDVTLTPTQVSPTPPFTVTATATAPTGTIPTLTPWPETLYPSATSSPP